MKGWNVLRQVNGIPWMIPWSTGRYYSCDIGVTPISYTIAGPNIYFSPIYVPNDSIDINSLGVEVISGTTGTFCRIALYEMTNRLQVGERLLQTGEILLGTVGHQSASVSYSLRQGWYWMVTTFSVGAGGAVRGFTTTQAMSRGILYPANTDVVSWGFRTNGSPNNGDANNYVTSGFPSRFYLSQEENFLSGNFVRFLIGT